MNNNTVYSISVLAEFSHFKLQAFQIRNKCFIVHHLENRK